MPGAWLRCRSCRWRIRLSQSFIFSSTTLMTPVVQTIWSLLRVDRTLWWYEGPELDLQALLVIDILWSSHWSFFFFNAIIIILSLSLNFLLILFNQIILLKATATVCRLSTHIILQYVCSFAITTNWLSTLVTGSRQAEMKWTDGGQKQIFVCASSTEQPTV